MKGIYLIINPTNKVYVGEAKDIEKRWKQYFKLDCKQQPALYRSLLKYGFENHEYIALTECEDGQERKDQEGYFCLLFKKLGFEILTCRWGGIYKGVSEETRKKMSESGKKRIDFNYLIGIPKSDEAKYKMSLSKRGIYDGEKNPFFGKKHSKETLKKQSEKKKGKNHPMFGVRGKNHPNFGKVRSEDFKRQQSKSVLQYSKSGELIKEWYSAREVKRILNIDNSDIGKCANGKMKSAGGYGWKYNLN